ncbi:MAG: CPBP family intramembrane metalloprotease [Crocinitomicaceae bacterium TMED114]|nr:MAG: CPBP family intramembrane metalloprotease [Crocinitomicaceae bacterium TMED114]|tara:strand:- start:327 stop:1223 length:897 start_codon:yes stop_codon:yes gene_type:complete
MKSEPADRMQALSRTLIFLGILLVASVLASIAASVVAATVFGEAFSMSPGQALPTEDSVWWQLHLQNFISQAVGFGGAAWVAGKIWSGAFPVGLPGKAAGRIPAVLLLAVLATVVCSPLLAASYEWNGTLIPEGGALEALFLPLEEMIEALTTYLAMADGGRRIIVILSVAALPAVFEELAFRGVLQPLLIRATGKAWLGIALTSIIFSAIHFQFYGFLPRVLLGALFGWLVYRSGSLIPGMLAHFVNNSLAAATLWVTGSMADDLMDLTPMLIGGSLLLTALATVACDRVIRRSTPA